jgi:hypothetical protein
MKPHLFRMSITMYEEGRTLSGWCCTVKDRRAGHVHGYGKSATEAYESCLQSLANIRRLMASETKGKKSLFDAFLSLWPLYHFGK